MDSDVTGAMPRRHESAAPDSTGDASAILRHVRLDTGHNLRTWDTGRSIGTGMMARTRIGYELRDPAGEVLFRGADFAPGAATADDSDEALRALCGFLFLRPGDTDREYFADYSPRQLAFARSGDCELLAFLYSDNGPGQLVDIDGEDAGREAIR